MKQLKQQWPHIRCLAQITLLTLLSYQSAMAMQVLSDAELEASQGQALFNLSYLAPTDASSNSKINGNVGFYRLGMEADVELNTNIKSVQLGCGGANGAGGCDLDIDYLSLSGTGDSSDARAASSALISNPFIEFAIKNPDNAALRQLAGFRLSAEAMQGLLTFGLENGDAASGIKSFSGYLVTDATTGKVTTNAFNNITQAQTGVEVTGRAKSTTGLINTSFTSTDYNMNLSSASGDLVMNQQVITGKRISTANLAATARVSGIQLSGSLSAKTGILIPVSTNNLKGTINNLGVDVTIQQGLGYFHKATLNGTAGSLSSQSQNIKWPGTASIAQKGWWLELTNPIEIGEITPTNNVDIAMSTIKETLGIVSENLKNNPVNCGFLATSCLLGNIDVGTVDLNKYSRAAMTLENVVLEKQNFAPNCWGNLKFC